MIGAGRRDGADRVSDLAERRRAGRIARLGGREAVSGSRVQHLPSPGSRRAAGRCSKGCSARPCSSRAARRSSVDEAYLRESILNPAAKITAGFQPIMPTFQGLVSEEQLLELIEYVKSLQSAAAGADQGSHGPAPTVLTPPRHYLNDGYGITSWLLTRDHKRIALLYLAAVTFFFFVGGAFAVLIRLELATPAGDLVSRRDLQQAVHDARRDDGVLLPDPGHPGGARQLPRADHDRREGSGVSEAEPR